MDASGTVQLKLDEKLHDLCDVPVESVIEVHGTVARRAPGAENPNMPTGQVEVLVHSWKLLNKADSLPFYPTQCIDEQNLPNEALRARHRYLDLRRPALGSAIRRRSHVSHAARTYLYNKGVLEIETPMLLRSTPEGAREFLVPTRTQGADPQFYALQQSPQQPKQLLMASGVTEAYYQLARCFRDEDGRRDRQPEFTQLDMEMSFVSGTGEPAAPGAHVWRIGGTEVRDLVEGLVHTMWKAADMGTALPARFPVMPYAYAMQTYGSDKPDLRFGLEISDLAPTLQSDSPFALDILVCPHHEFEKPLRLSAKQTSQLLLRKDGSRSSIEHFKASVADPPVDTILKKSRHVRSILGDAEPAGDFSGALAAAIKASSVFVRGKEAPEASRCDIFISLRPKAPEGGSTEMGDLRLALANALGEIRADVRDSSPHILWVTEFPLFTHADAEKDEAAHGRWSSSHHPFTAPLAEDIPVLLRALDEPDSAARQSAIASIHGQHFDLVLDGQEIGGGSVRIHDPTLQELVFRRVLELTDDETQRFGHLLKALRCGAPPHAGMALGFDRLMAILCGRQSIRDVIAFPKSTSGFDPLFRSPAALGESPDEAQGLLAPYRLKIDSFT
ncbi:aspartate--tRNA ligase [Malassezia cuniculi]|uniref:Aspartate--tRNA ligase n=1 Tax=Malassezia cuniculi TaxID=948313 RepID=A0AAF0J6J8_9BASI|nr:aspartate--tRNA ligase [Malassezia cuniculi]